MADKADISVKLEIEGDKAYKNSIKAINAELKALKSELDLATASMDEMENTEEDTAKKSEILEKTIDKQEQKLSLMNQQYEKSVSSLEDLGKALENAKGEFGANSEAALKAQNAYNKSLSEVMSFKNEINKTSIELVKSKKGLEELINPAEKSKDSFEELQETVDEAGNSLKNIEKIAANSNSGFGKFAESAKGIKEVFAGNLLADGAKAIAGKVADLASSFINLDEATAELRENLGKVDTAFETSGKSAENGRKAYKDFYKILGDSDTAAESAQLLAQLARSEQDVADWSKIATGVVGTFGDALPINSLIEAANETAKVGKVTGVLADALNWVGISEDEFNEKLAAASTEQERNALITKALTASYEEAAAAYEENNAALLRSRELQAQLDESLASLGGTVQDIKNGLLADFLPAIVQIIEGFNDFINGVDDADEALASGISNMVDTIIAKLPEFAAFAVKVIAEIAKALIMNSPTLALAGVEVIIALIEAVSDLIGEFITIGANIVSGLWEGIKSRSSWLKNQVKSWCNSILDTAKEFFGINSPSKLFEQEIGQFLPAGIAVGIDKGAKDALAGMNDFNTELLNAASLVVPQASASAENQGLVESLLNGMSTMQNQAINLVAQVVLPNGEVLAETVFNDLLNVSKQRGISFA